MLGALLCCVLNCQEISAEFNLQDCAYSFEEAVRNENVGPMKVSASEEKEWVVVNRA